MTVIDMESIESATESEDINYIYQSDEVQKIIDEMFIVSVDNAENIEVEFKDCFNIKERLEKWWQTENLLSLIYRKIKLCIEIRFADSVMLQGI